MSEQKMTWQDLTFDRNAVIEASAGTGKTYTLEHIVEKLVTREKDPLDVRQILLVTFTDKAAGELKERVRKILAKTGHADHVDEATICTIHSFCQQVLGEYPIESGMDMGMEAGGSDDALYARAVHSVLTSKTFQEAHSENFHELMDTWNPGADVCSLESECMARLRDVFDVGGFDAWIRQVRQGLWPQLKDLIGQLPGWNEGGPGKSVLNHTQGGLTLGRGAANARYKEYFESLDGHLKCLQDETSPEESENAALQFLSEGKVDFSLQKWDGQRVAESFCARPGFRPYDALRKIAGARMDEKNRFGREGIVRDVLALAYPQFVLLKARTRTMTFNDLIRETARLVETASGENATAMQRKFVGRIRGRYRIALVDEFQDTDARQWTIFRNLFASVGRLIVVGDPKQAIYGWRGADLATYLKAKEKILAGGGQEVPLDTMYRSTQQMVDDFNTMFQSGWFADMAEDGISYGEVKFPTTGIPDNINGFKYPDNEHAVEWLEAGAGLQMFIGNAANEMIRLHGDSIWKEKMPWDKMCVLVRAHKDGEVARDVLRGKNIPCRIYKEGGIYTSEEAEGLLALFDYLSLPRSVGNLSALLLTPLFGVAPENLATRLANGDTSFDRLCEKWRAFADKRNWIALFESVMRDTAARNNPAGYRQILDELLESYGRSTTVAELAAALRGMRNGDASAGEDASIRNRADEGPAVQIMTMHVAKGLEFNAVFIMAGLSGFGAMSAAEKSRQIDEQKRLFYVALTRAAFKLYLPWSAVAAQDGMGKNDSALDTYLGTAIRVLCGNDASSRERKVTEPQPLPSQERPVRSCGELPPSRGMKGWRFKWDSFTSMNHHGTTKSAEVADVKLTEDETGTEAPVQKSLVPKGALSGTVFHEVMEQLCKNSGDRDSFAIGKVDDFESLIAEDADSKSPLLGIVRRRLSANGVVNRVEKGGNGSTAVSLARMAWNALRTELSVGGEKVRLCNIEPKNRKAEVNFVIDEELLLAAGVKRDGALNGSIDLLVRLEDSDDYVIVDWKTNALEAYDEESVKAAMDEADYHLQYEIYALAAEKWLGGAKVKGVAYLFVRGGESGDATPGVFQYAMTDVERGTFAAKLAERLAQSDAAETEKEEGL